MLVSRTAPQSPAAEAYRRLRTSLQVLGLGQQHQVVQIASPSPHDGRTTTVANLGLSLARAGCRVVLVDANLRRPRLHSFFGLDNEVGLSSLLLRDASLAAALVSVPGEPRLSLLPSGPSPIDPAELLSTSHAQQLFSSISAEADFVLVDGPPLLPVTDAIVLAGLVDAVLLVVRANRTPRADLLHSLELLEQVRAPLVGTALNVTNARRDRGFTYRHGPYLRRQHRRRVPVFLRRGAGKGERAGEPARQA